MPHRFLGRQVQEGRTQRSCSSYTDVYEANDGKHGNVPRGDISAEPSMPSIALQNSVGVGRARIGYDGLNGQIVVFRLTRTDEQKCIRYWHGYVVYQRDLTPEQWKAGRDAGFPQLASKAQVMSTEIFSLPLKRFALEIDLDIDMSVQYTRDFHHHGPDFLFAVAELWMNVGVGRYLIYPKSMPGNFFEDIASIAAAISSPPSSRNLELTGCGGWCSWMSAYWDRLGADSLAADDEMNYQKLIRLSMLESRVGHLAIYRYGDLFDS